jgi:protein-S-isoprenylcysteine O-methyltransferase Ste14
MVRIGSFLFRYRNRLVPLALLLVLIPSRPLFDNPLVAVGTGFCFAMAGQAVRAFTIGLAYIIRGGRDGHPYAEDLVTEGAYALSRNPMYVGNMLIMIGLAIASNSMACLLIAIPLFVFVYSAIVAAEEAFLHARFGAAYARYAMEVPRWLPRISALVDARREGRFHWKRVLVKEFATPFGWLSALFAICVLHLATNNALATRHGVMPVLVACYAGLAAVYLSVRYLKLSRRIVAD